MSGDPFENVRKSVESAAADVFPASEVDSVARLMREVGDLLENASRNHGSPAVVVACRAGCPHCCRVNVSVLLPEAIAIAHYLERTPSWAAADTARLADWADMVRWLDHDERIRKNLGCPFLDRDGACSIHPVRPLMCRSITSTDPEACVRSLDLAAWGEDEPVQMDLFRKIITDEAYRALAAALSAAGLDNRPVELARGVAAILQRPQLAADFLGGKMVEWD